MLTKKRLLLLLLLVTNFMVLSVICVAQSVTINNDIQNKRIVFGNDKISMIIDYSRKANISSVTLNGQKIIEGDAGIYTTIRTKNVTYSTLELLSEPSAKVTNHTITISGIRYGDKTLSVNETWTFIITNSNIKFNIERTIS